MLHRSFGTLQGRDEQGVRTLPATCRSQEQGSGKFEQHAGVHQRRTAYVEYRPVKAASSEVTTVTILPFCEGTGRNLGFRVQGSGFRVQSGSLKKQDLAAL